VVVGGGFAGTWAALAAGRELLLNKAEARVILVNRDPFITMRPRLYEPFTPEMRLELSPVLSALDISLRVAQVDGLDLAARTVNFGPGPHDSLRWDALVIAAGSVQRPLPVPGAAEHALDIDTFGGAERLAQHLQRVLARPKAEGALTFVVIGAGFTGIELATELRRHLRNYGRESLASEARIVLVEADAVPGPALGAGPRPLIEAALERCKVEVRLNTRVTAIDASGITLASGEHIPSLTVVITSGLQANPLGTQLPGERDESGRLVVDGFLRLPGQEHVFVAGDMAHARTDESHTALMSCQHAVPMGKMAGYNAARALLGLSQRTYQQPDYVTCLDLGDGGAVLTSGWDRQVVDSGAEIKTLKQTINTRWILPPSGGRESVLPAADLDAPWPPAA